MPDLMTHVAVTHILRRCTECTTQRDMAPRVAAVLYLGAVLPDIPSRLPMIVSSSAAVFWPAAVMHSPIPVALQGIIVIAAFARERVGLLYAMLLGSAMLHELLDLFQRSIGEGTYFWTFPFSWARGQLPLFWPSDAVLAVPILFVLALGIEFLRLRSRRSAG